MPAVAPIARSRSAPEPREQVLALALSYRDLSFVILGGAESFADERFAKSKNLCTRFE
jgi:hypothetical protein